jgi:hypothetical protein
MINGLMVNVDLMDLIHHTGLSTLDWSSSGWQVSLFALDDY